MPHAAIEINSHHIQLIIANDDGVVLYDDSQPIGLGERGLLRPDRIDAALELLEDYAMQAYDAGVAPQSVCTIATSAIRRALNIQTFTERVKQVTQLDVRVLNGEDEAHMAWMGALGGLRLPKGPTLVIAVAGQHTEAVLGEHDRIGMNQKLELGADRLTTNFMNDSTDRYRPADLAKLRSHIDRHISRVTWRAMPRSLVAMGTLANILSQMELNASHEVYNSVHGYRLTRAALQRWIDRLLFSSQDERVAWSRANPAVANHLLAGACVLESISRSARKSTYSVSTGGIRHGALSAHWM